MRSRMLLHALKFKAFFLFILCQFSLLYAVENKSHPFWKVSSEHNTVYILGSVHVLTAENYPLPKKFYEAFAECNTLVLEASMDSLKLPATSIKMMQRGMFQDDKTFKDAVSEKTYQRTAEYLASFGVNIQMFAKAKPWFMALTLTALEVKKMGLNADLGLDNHFAEKAKAQDMAVKGLEAIDFQINIFDNLLPKTQETFLLKTLDDAEGSQELLGDMLEAWEMGDNTALEILLNDSFQGFPELRDKVLTNRNKSWVEAITSYLSQSEPYFIVVGAGHLVGETGVVELLKKEGFEVTRL